MFKDLYLANPEYLFILIIIPAILFFWYKFEKYTQASLTHSSLSYLKAKDSLLTKLRPLLNIIRVLVILLLIFAISRPQSKSTSKGLQRQEVLILLWLLTSLQVCYLKT